MTNGGIVSGATNSTAQSVRPGSRVRSTNHAHVTPITTASGVATTATSSECSMSVRVAPAVNDALAAEKPPWNAWTTAMMMGVATTDATATQSAISPRDGPGCPARFNLEPPFVARKVPRRL